jgi:hypothetical protein
VLTLAPGTKVFLATEAVDLRRGHDGLCALLGGFDVARAPRANVWEPASPRRPAA